MATDRREERVRQLMDGPHPHVPPDFSELAIEQGRRLVRRRRLLRNVLLTVALFAIVAFAIWALTAEPWNTQPTPVTPPGFDW